MKSFIVSMMSDVDGQVSSKRFITIVAFLCLVLAFLCNVFAAIPLQEFVYDGMLYLVGSGLGFSTVEKFSRSSGVKHDEQ
jgi:phosphotransferase system  glucose/maltose/N-acetylglucosamine-specific IIC component